MTTTLHCGFHFFGLSWFLHCGSLSQFLLRRSTHIPRQSPRPWIYLTFFFVGQPAFLASHRGVEYSFRLHNASKIFVLYYKWVQIHTRTHTYYYSHAIKYIYVHTHTHGHAHTWYIYIYIYETFRIHMWLTTGELRPWDLYIWLWLPRLTLTLLHKHSSSFFI